MKSKKSNGVAKLKNLYGRLLVYQMGESIFMKTSFEPIQASWSVYIESMNFYSYKKFEQDLAKIIRYLTTRLILNNIGNVVAKKEEVSGRCLLYCIKRQVDFCFRGQVFFKNLMEYLGVVDQNTYYSLQGQVGGLKRTKTPLRNRKRAPKVLLSNLYTVQESLEVKRVKRRGRQFPTQIPTNFSYFEFHHYSF